MGNRYDLITMTTEQIETTLNQLSTQVQQLTASINSIVNTLSNFATTDDLSVVADQISALQQDNTSLSNSVASLSSNVQNINNLKNLIDVQIDDLRSPLTEGDILQYGYDGKWHNVKLPEIDSTGSSSSGSSSSGASKLSELSDVLLSSVYDGQVLTWDSSLSMWKNKTVTSSSTGSTGGMTQADADSRYLQLSGGTLSGDLLVKGDITMQ